MCSIFTIEYGVAAGKIANLAATRHGKGNAYSDQINGAAERWNK